MTAYPHDAPIDLDHQQAAQERCAIPDYWDYPTIEDWTAAHPITLPPEHAAALEAERALWSARIAALDGLGDAAGYARMVIKAWREGQR